MLNNIFNQFLPQDPIFNTLSILFILIIISIISFYITEKIILNVLSKMFKKTSTQLDDILLKSNIFNRLSYILPALIFYNLAYTLPNLTDLIQRLSLGLITISSLLASNSFLNALNNIYDKSRFSNKINIKSYVQITKLIINIIGSVIVIAFLMNKNPTWVLSGLGAMTAVLLIIFKDTILSFVASIQINSNDLFKVGDWIEAPQFGADGDVIDIALHTVKIQNWDKTISIIPTHKLIDSTFRNWRGMSNSGGRRIKRSLLIDMNSIQLCNEEMIESFKKIALIKDYVINKVKEIESYNTLHQIDLTTNINGRQLTNIGTFRAYIKIFLKNNKKIHPDMTFLVRQLEPTSNGLPLQIYVFTNDTDWIRYEEIQADIFDHILAITSEFKLNIFQNPTGNDFLKLNNN